MTIRESIKNKLPLLMIISVFCLYLLFINNNSFNLPLWDDYDNCLKFLSNYKLSNSFNEKFMLIVSQHSEHRMVFTRLIELIYYKIFGQVNFRHLIFIGNILLLGIVYLVIKIFMSTFKTEKFNSYQTQLLIVIILSFLLSPIQFGAQIWTDASTEFYGNIFFTLLIINNVIKLMNKPNASLFIIFIILNTINTFICGSFVALNLSIMLVTLYNKKYKLTIFITLIYGLLAYIYFIALPYTFLPKYPNTIVQQIEFFLNFLSCGLNFNFKLLSLLIGLSVVCAIFLLRQEIISNRVLMTWFMFLIIVDVMTAHQRGGFGNNGLSSRYAIFSLISYVFIIMLFLKKYPKFIMHIAIISFSIFLAYFIVVPRTHFFINRYNQIKFGVFYPDIPSAIKMYNQANSLGIYSNEQLEHNIENLKK